jgi:flagellar motor switch protein FliM
VPLNQLAAIAPGSLLTFERTAAAPATLLIAGVEAFHAMPARAGDTRAARILERVAEADSPRTTKERSR